MAISARRSRSVKSTKTRANVAQREQSRVFDNVRETIKAAHLVNSKRVHVLQLWRQLREPHEQNVSDRSPSASKEMNHVDTVPRHHERSVHAERNYLCQLCGRGFVYPKDLERHGKDAHSPIRPYLCPNTACWYSTEGFKRSDNLKRHVEGQACPTPWPFDVYLASGR